jgi:signal transduction histidine kinase
MSTTVARLERMGHRLGHWQLYVPYATLAASSLLVLIAHRYDRSIPQKPWPITLAVVAATVVWQYAYLTRHPGRLERRGPMLIFFIVLLALATALIWCCPLFGFFAWTGYLYTPAALRGMWCLLGATAVACLGAVSQTGGFPGVAHPSAWPTLGVVLLINILIADIMTFVAVRDNEHQERRAQEIDALAEANGKLAAALSENAGLHAQLLAQAREAGKLDERQRMAGEIHDVLAQGLTGIVTQLEAAGAAGAGSDESRRHLEAAKRLARESLTEARRSVQALRPQTLDESALPEAIGEVVEGWSRLAGVRAELITTGVPQPLLPEIETTLLRTAQEALANVARHAAAGRVALTLSYMEDVVTLDVRDDGAGFDPAAPLDPGYEGGYGLSTMRERVNRIAGTLAVESEPGGGTAVSACVPAIPLSAAA